MVGPDKEGWARLEFENEHELPAIHRALYEAKFQAEVPAWDQMGLMSPFTASVQRRIADHFFANTDRAGLRLEEVPSDQEQVVEWLCERGAWWTEMSPERRREHVRTLASPLRVSDEEADRLIAQADRRVSGEDTINARVEALWFEESRQLVTAEPPTPNGSRLRQLPLSAFVPGDAEEFQVRVVADIRTDVAPGAYEMTFLVVASRSVTSGWVTPCLRLAALSEEGVVEALDELLRNLNARSWPDLVAKLRRFTTPLRGDQHQREC